VLELLPQVVRVHAHHRVLAWIEVGALAEYFHRNLEFFRSATLGGTVDEKFEQPCVRTRPTERTARRNLLRLLA